MGIPRYYLNLNSQFGATYVHRLHHLKGKPIQKIYFDLNNLLYPVAMHSTPFQFVKDLCITIETTVLNHISKNPSNIYFFMDGTAPRAKLLTQRARRNEETTFFSSFSKKPSNFKTNPLHFTPGTTFMDSLTTSMIEYCKRKSLEYTQTTFHISGSNTPGEGEFKIFQHIAQGDRIPENILIVGADSDLIVFALLAPIEKNIFVLKNRELYDITKLRTFILQNSGKFHSDPKRTMIDFAFLSILSGNDYIPKLRGYSFATTWNRYIQSEQYLTELVNEKLSLNFNLFNKVLTGANTEHSKRNTSNSKSILQRITFGLLRIIPTYEIREDKTVVLLNQVEFGWADGINKVSQSLAAEMALENIRKNEEFLKMISHHKISRETLVLEMANLIQDEQEDVESFNVEVDSIGQEDINLYFDGLTWVLNFLHGVCHHPEFYFVNRPISKFHLGTCIGTRVFSVKERSEVLLVPKACALALLPAKALNIIPRELHPVVQDPEMRELFEGNVQELTTVWNQRDTPKRLADAVEKVRRDVSQVGFQHSKDVVVKQGRII
jgi:5'-3' exonuclease